jgi:hypothetical protein
MLAFCSPTHGKFAERSISPRRQPAHHQPVEPRCERGRVGGHLAVKNRRLIEQQGREVGHIVVARLRLGGA